MNKIICRKTKDRKKCCDTCKYSSTDGFFAPYYWCNKIVHHGNRDGLIYDSYIKDTGTVCDDWETKLVSDKEYNISTNEGIQEWKKEIMTIIEDVIDKKLKGENE